MSDNSPSISSSGVISDDQPFIMDDEIVEDKNWENAGLRNVVQLTIKQIINAFNKSETLNEYNGLMIDEQLVIEIKLCCTIKKITWDSLGNAILSIDDHTGKCEVKFWSADKNDIINTKLINLSVCTIAGKLRVVADKLNIDGYNIWRMVPEINNFTHIALFFIETIYGHSVNMAHKDHLSQLYEQNRIKQEKCQIEYLKERKKWRSNYKQQDDEKMEEKQPKKEKNAANNTNNDITNNNNTNNRNIDNDDNENWQQTDKNVKNNISNNTNNNNINNNNSESSNTGTNLQTEIVKFIENDSSDEGCRVFKILTNITGFNWNEVKKALDELEGKGHIEHDSDGHYFAL